MTIPPFHLAFPVHDLAAAREFYGNLLGCEEGRSADTWIDFNLYGHQIVTHVTPSASAISPESNPVDGHDVPVPHFGVILPWEDWEQLAEKLKAAEINFVIEPYVRFARETGEQASRLR